MKVKLPVTQYQEVDIRLPLQKEITEHLVKRVCGYNDMYLKGDKIFKTNTNGIAYERYKKIRKKFRCQDAPKKYF